MRQLKLLWKGISFLFLHPKTSLRILASINLHGERKTKSIDAETTSLEDFLQEKLKPVKLTNTKSYGESSPNYDIFVLCSIVKSFNFKNIFEIGTDVGKTTVNLAENTLGKVYTLDINQRLKKQRNIIPLEGDTRYFDFSPYYNKMDFIFIDAGHEFENVYTDSCSAFKCIKNGGVITWHDFNKGHKHVIDAIKLFCKEYNQKIKLIEGSNIAVSIIKK